MKIQVRDFLSLMLFSPTTTKRVSKTYFFNIIFFLEEDHDRGKYPPFHRKPVIFWERIPHTISGIDGGLDTDEAQL